MNQWRNQIFTFSCLFVFCVFISCKNSSKYKQNDQLLHLNTIIDQKGIYTNDSLNLSLKIYLENTLVQYQLSDLENNLLFQSSSPSFSNVHNWGIVLDETGTFWIQSSDIGLYLLTKDKDLAYKLESFGALNEQNIKRLPPKIYKLLPSSLKEP